MTERLRCEHCRRVIQLPAIEDDTLADREFAEFFGIPVGTFLCFWCMEDFSTEPWDRGQHIGGRA
jgi:hypothetical protein